MQLGPVVMYSQHVHYTVADQYIWNDDFGSIDEDIPATDRDSEICSVHGRKNGAVCQARAVTDSAL
jgi:hypothetical protein